MTRPAVHAISRVRLATPHSIEREFPYAGAILIRDPHCVETLPRKRRSLQLRLQPPPHQPFALPIDHPGGLSVDGVLSDQSEDAAVTAVAAGIPHHEHLTRRNHDRGDIEAPTERQIEAARVAMTRKIKRGGKIWIRIFPDKPYTKKPAETRMGSGKGNPEGWVAVVRAGRIMFEMSGVDRENAIEALNVAAQKLPIKTTIAEVLD